MENHPIPQDVTGFQFKLIGDMTVKQFAYIAAGAILAWLCFSILPLPLNLLFALGSALFGVGLAFFPIEGRPMDVMVINFLKALVTPTLYIYQKTGGHLTVAASHAQKTHVNEHKQMVQTSSSTKLQEYLASLHQDKHSKLDEKETIYFQSLSALYGNQPVPQIQPVTQPQPIQEPVVPPTAQPSVTAQEELLQQQEVQQPQEEKDETALTHEAEMLREELAKAKQQETQQQNTPTAPQAHEKVLTLEQELTETLAQKERLEKELMQLQQQLDQQKKQIVTPSQAPAETKLESPHVRAIPKQAVVATGAPLVADVPNLVTGVIKDPRGNVLPGILVEIKDQEGNPVRAFRTNPLGQFASATPLMNGVYTIEFEDPKGTNTFDVVEIETTGEIMMPLEIISTDAREELRRSLFTQ